MNWHPARTGPEADGGCGQAEGEPEADRVWRRGGGQKTESATIARALAAVSDSPSPTSCPPPPPPRRLVQRRARSR